MRETAIATVERPKTAVAAQGGSLHLDGAVRGEHGGWRGGVSVWEEGTAGCREGERPARQRIGNVRGGMGWGDTISSLAAAEKWRNGSIISGGRLPYVIDRD